MYHSWPKAALGSRVGQAVQCLGLPGAQSSYRVAKAGFSHLKWLIPTRQPTRHTHTITSDRRTHTRIRRSLYCSLHRSRIVPVSFPCPDPHRVPIPSFQSHEVVQVVRRGTCEDIWRQRYPGRRYATCHGPRGGGTLESTSAHPSGPDILGTHLCNPRGETREAAASLRGTWA